MPILLDNGATIADTGDAPGDLLQEPRQIEFNGLLMGSGTPFRWMELTGWDDMPGVELSDSDRPNDHGFDPGAGLFQARMPSYTIRVEGGTRDLMESRLQLLTERMNYSDTEQILAVYDSARALYANARVVGRTVPHTPMRSVGILDVAVQWKCSPLRRQLFYSRQVTLRPGQTSGGLEYENIIGIGGLEYPLFYGLAGLDSSQDVPNSGNAPAPALITFYGPATKFGVTLDTGLKLELDLPIVVGDTVTVDTATGTVLLNNSSDRSGWLSQSSDPPESWRIPPSRTYVTSGAYNPSARFAADGYDLALTKVEIKWADTYW